MGDVLSIVLSPKIPGYFALKLSSFTCLQLSSTITQQAWNQGSKGIRQLMIHKITPSLDYNSWLKRLNTQLYE